MTEAETQEYRRLVNLWHCTEPMTKEQTERMDYLHGLTTGSSFCPSTSRIQIQPLINPKP